MHSNVILTHNWVIQEVHTSKGTGKIQQYLAKHREAKNYLNSQEHKMTSMLSGFLENPHWMSRLDFVSVL